MTSNPTVSVIIPAYNAEKTVAAAIDSLLAQTVPPNQILVIDDGSPDDIATPLLPYGDKVTLLRKPNGGAASARNMGLDHATCDMITFLDADDYWEPEKLERQLDAYRNNPELKFAASVYYHKPPDEEREIRALEGDGRFIGQVSVTHGSEAFELARLIWTSTVMVPRAAVGDNRFVSGLEPAEDLDLWIRLIPDRPVFFDDQPLATWVLDSGSLSHASLDRDCGNMLRVVRRNADLLGPDGLRYWEANTFKRWAGNHLAQGRPFRAVYLSLRRLKREPLGIDGWYIFLKSLVMSVLPRKSQ